MTLINRTFLILLVSAVLVVGSSFVLQFLILNEQTEMEARQLLFQHEKMIASHFVTNDSIRFAEAAEFGFNVQPVEGERGGEEKFRTDKSNGIEYLVYTTTIDVGGKDVIVEIRKDMSASIGFRNNLLMIHLYTLIAIVLTFISVKLIAFNSIWNQLRKSLELLKKRELHTRKVTFPRSSIREIDELNKELNDLSVFLNREYHSQKEFIENLTHELFTPISNIRGKLELLIQSENLKEKDLKLIDKAMDGLNRLIRVNRSLIVMTKVENSERIEKQQFHIGEIVDLSLDLFEDQIRMHGLHVAKRVEHNSLIFASRDMIEILVVNLLRNAILHNHDDGTVEILIGKARLSIRNTGRSGSLESGKIFRRFSSDSEYSQSVGLGLAISRRICEASNIGISYAYMDNMHEFTLDLSQVMI